MNTNEDLQKRVLEAIAWEPLIDEAEIGVTAKNGVVTLTGIVDNYAKKVQAERAVKNVLGVKAVVEKIEINYHHKIKTDEDVAMEIVDAIEWNAYLRGDEIKIIVSNGWVYLHGHLDWNYQKSAIRKDVEKIVGVKGIIDFIKINASKNLKNEKRVIENAIQRHSSLQNKNIKVAISRDVVTLTGTVSAYFQKEEAERIAWNSPGICTVNNLLTVDQVTI